jgi:translation elongation factor EF-Tu-like GTPase
MVKIKAYIELYKTGRKTPFHSGYRPLFNFQKEMKTSGEITLIDMNKFSPGDNGIVKINFLNRDFLGDDFKEGKKFVFDEGGEPLGEGIVTEIL